MIDRCELKSGGQYKDYGGRGITVCARWRHNYLVFLADMGRKPSPELTLERINNNRGYYPSNCKWATRIEQRKNSRERPKRLRDKKGQFI